MLRTAHLLTTHLPLQVISIKQKMQHVNKMISDWFSNKDNNKSSAAKAVTSGWMKAVKAGPYAAKALYEERKGKKLPGLATLLALLVYRESLFKSGRAQINKNAKRSEANWFSKVKSRSPCYRCPTTKKRQEPSKASASSQRCRNR